MLIGQAEEVLCPKGHTALQRHAEGEGEGDGLLCMSLPQSPLLFSSHLSPMHRLYHLYILHYHFALCTFQTHRHTQAQEHYLALSIHTSTRTLYIFCTIHTSSTRILSSWTPTLSQSLHSVP